MIAPDRWQRFVGWWTELFSNGPDLEFSFSDPSRPEAVFMSIDHARAINTAMKQSIGNLEKCIHETKETGSFDSFTSAVYTQLCLVSFVAGAGEHVLMPYLSTVIPETIMNYDEHAVDQPDRELDYEDDDEDDPENEGISMSPDWKENCYSWLNLICLHSSSSISLTQLSSSSKGSWLLDSHYVFVNRKLSDNNTMEPWRDTIRQIFGENTDWVQKLEKLNEVPIKKGAHRSLDPLQDLLFTGDWSNIFRGSVHCEMFLTSGILNVDIYVDKSGIQPN